MAERSQWIFRGGGAMRKRYRPQRWIPCRCGIERENGLLAKFVVIECGNFHEEIVRVLAVDNGLAEGGFTLLEEFGIIAAGDGGGFEAEHGTQGQFAGTELPL